MIIRPPYPADKRYHINIAIAEACVTKYILLRTQPYCIYVCICGYASILCALRQTLDNGVIPLIWTTFEQELNFTELFPVIYYRTHISTSICLTFLYWIIIDFLEELFDVIFHTDNLIASISSSLLISPKLWAIIVYAFIVKTRLQFPTARGKSYYGIPNQLEYVKREKKCG